MANQHKELSQQKFNDIKQSEEELQYFKKLYSQELYSHRDSSVTMSIIRNLEAQIDREKTEYYRLKNVSSCSQ